MSARSTPLLGIQALCLLSAVAVLLLSGSDAAWSQAATDLFDEGIERYRAGDYPEAQRLLREYVEAQAEEGGPAAVHLGEAYHHLGLMTPDAELAEGYFLAVAQRYPTSPIADESLARLGHLYTALENLPEARRQWQALARDYPLSRFLPEVDLRIGQTYFTEGEWEKAYAAFSAGFAKMKNFQRAGGRGANLRELEGAYVYWLGRTLLARRAFDDSRKYLNLVLLDYPGHPLEPLALYYLAENYREDGKTEEAEEAWRRFSESARNSSLEPIAENPDLIAIARARELGALARPPGAEPRETGETREAVPEPRPDREENAPDAGAPGLRAPSQEEGLRAPEPGRAGGIVQAEPFGRRVEQPSEVEKVPAEAGEVETAGRPAREERPAPATLEPLPTGVVYLQAGAFTSAASAGKLSTVLKQKGFEPAIHSGLVNGQGYYRVRFGPYQLPRDRSALEATRAALADAGFETIVMRQERTE